MRKNDNQNVALMDELRRVVLAVEASGRAFLPSSSEELLQTIAETSARIFGARAASIGLVNEKEQVLEFDVAVGAGSEDIIGTKIGLDQGVVGYVASTGQPLALSRVESDPRFTQDIARRTGYIPGSILATPLVLDDHILGVMEVVDRGDDAPFGMGDMELLGLFGRQAAIAIHLARQFDLLGQVLVQRIAELVNPDNLPDRAAIQAVLEAEPEAGGPTGDLVEIADLFNSVSQLGPAERRAAVEILRAFAEYVHARPRIPEFQDE